jgi:hypothetical protein
MKINEIINEATDKFVLKPSPKAAKIISSSQSAKPTRPFGSTEPKSIQYLRWAFLDYYNSGISNIIPAFKEAYEEEPSTALFVIGFRWYDDWSENEIAKYHQVMNYLEHTNPEDAKYLRTRYENPPISRINKHS